MMTAEGYLEIFLSALIITMCTFIFFYLFYVYKQSSFYDPKKSQKIILLFVTLLIFFYTFLLIGFLRFNTPTKELRFANKDTIQQATTIPFNQMIDGLEKKLNSSPNDLENWKILARSYLTLGKKNEAKQKLEQAKEFFPDDTDILVSLARLLIDMENVTKGHYPKVPEQSGQLLNKAFTIDNKEPSVLWFLGLYEVQKKNFSRAITLWETLRSISSDKSPEYAILNQSITDAKNEKILIDH